VEATLHSPFLLRRIMPVKYSILSSHADATPKAGTKTSSYPKGKSSKSSKSSKKMKPSSKKAMY
jgi:hypothetical protein